MKNNKSLLLRTVFLALLLALMIGAFLWLVYDSAINNYIDPKTSSAINTFYTDKTIQAARGNITDRYGNVLVGNKAEYVVTLDVDAMGEPSDQAAIVSQLLSICKKQGVEWNDEEFPVSDCAPWSYTTDGNAYMLQNDDGTYSESRLYKLCKNLNDEYKDQGTVWASGTQTNATQLISNMSSFFGLSSSLSDSDRRTLLGVLYSAYLRSGTNQVVWTDYYFAEDVDMDFITAIKEANLAGVEIEAVSVRDYKTDLAAHLLGQVGAISAEKWEELKADPDNTYNMNDTIGLSGMESAFEKYLRGTDGVQRTTYDSEGNVINVGFPEGQEPRAGYSVTTTLDSGVQEAAQKALADYTEELTTEDGGSAVVVLDAKDSSILAAASYPTFDPATYTEDYEELSQEAKNPLYDRALLGVYAPGSTYKICTATAAISTGVSSLGRQINCTGRYTEHGLDQNCWYHAGHGLENLSDAIRDSCNVYFYTVGWEMGIEKLTAVAQSYGLGVSTGVELAESTGSNAGPEFAESIGGEWNIGNITSAAIGQSDNQFTVLQLANYIATFCRGGERLDAHLLKNVKSSDNSEIVYEHESQVLSTVDLSSATQEAITTGMGQVIEADDITYFEDLEKSGVKVGCKTGTAELTRTKSKCYNALFVAFAPIDDPEIVICSVVEKSPYAGAQSSCITADIMNYYFSEEATLERVENENRLLR